MLHFALLSSLRNVHAEHAHCALALIGEGAFFASLGHLGDLESAAPASLFVCEYKYRAPASALTFSLLLFSLVASFSAGEDDEGESFDVNLRFLT